MGETYRVTQETNASDINGGGPRFGASGGPIDSSDDCTVNAGALTVIVNNEGSWIDVQADDWLVWDTDGVKEHRKVQSVAGANITLTSAVSGAAANKKVRVGGAWNTLGHAADMVAAGDHVYVKTGTYNTQHGATGAVMKIQTAGEEDNVIIFEGYTSTPGDNLTGTSAVVIVDGQDTLGCVSTSLSGSTYHNYIFRGMRCTQSNGYGWNLYTYGITFEMCEADNNADSGFYLGNYASLFGCYSHDSDAGAGYALGAYSTIVNSRACNNAGVGICINNGMVHSCLVYGNGSYQVECSALSHSSITITNCTIDDVTNSHQGIYLSSPAGTARRATIINNIIVRCSVGIGSTAGNCLIFSRNNFLCTSGDYSNTTPTSGTVPTTGNVDGDPLFVDAASGDYRLKIKSPAIRAGWPEFIDIGALQAKRLPVSNPTNRGVQR